MDNFAFLLPFFMTVFGGIFLLARLWGQTSATPWGIGYLCAACGFCMPLLSVLPQPAISIIASTLFLTAFFFYGEGLSVRFGRSPYRGLRLAIALTSLAAIAYVALSRSDLRTELILGDLGLILLITPAWLSVSTAPGRVIDRLLVGAVGLVIAETSIRVASFAASTQAGDGASLGAYLESDYAFFSQLAASIVAFLLALTILGTAVADVIDRYRNAAEHDPLTLLLNRRGFDAIFARENARNHLAGAVVIGDIDHFKQVNDRFGHATGDAVLQGFAATLKQTLPEDAILARFGGEEFVIFFRNHSAAEARTRADILRQAMAARSWAAEGLDHRITASFGVAVRTASDHMIHDTIDRADASLYEAKRRGRNLVVVENEAMPIESAIRRRQP